MSLEHSPERQQRMKAVGSNQGLTSNDPAPELAPATNLLLGAESIALYIYGKAGRKEVRDVYRNPFGFSFFEHGNAIAALKSTIRAELHEAERAAQEALRQRKVSEARVVVKPRRRRARAATNKVT
jgi:ribonuclease BN (tRNA processing enzyme)